MGEIYVTLKTVRRRKITVDLLVVAGTAVVRTADSTWRQGDAGLVPGRTEASDRWPLGAGRCGREGCPSGPR